jgi:hypothetical protein
VRASVCRQRSRGLSGTLIDTDADDQRRLAAISVPLLRTLGHPLAAHQPTPLVFALVFHGRCGQLRAQSANAGLWERRHCRDVNGSVEYLEERGPQRHSSFAQLGNGTKGRGGPKRKRHDAILQHAKRAAPCWHQRKHGAVYHQSERHTTPLVVAAKRTARWQRWQGERR